MYVLVDDSFFAIVFSLSEEKWHKKSHFLSLRIQVHMLIL